MIDMDKEKREQEEDRQRRIFHHMSKESTCAQCFNTALVNATDGQYEYAFICDKCFSNEIWKFPVGRNFQEWNPVRFKNLRIIQSSPTKQMQQEVFQAVKNKDGFGVAMKVMTSKSDEEIKQLWLDLHAKEEF